MDGISLTLDTRAEAYRRYSGLDFLSVGGTAVYKRKFGLGANVPWMLASLSVARDDYRENVRDSNRLRVGTELGHRFSESFDGAVGIILDRRYGKSDMPEVPGYSGRVFDLQGRSAYARLGYAVNEKLLLGALMTVRRGDVESTAQQSYPIFLASDAIADDPAFRNANLYAYRLPATTYSGTVSASWALSDRSSVNFAYVDHRTRAGYGLAYNDRALTVSVAYRYP